MPHQKMKIQKLVACVFFFLSLSNAFALSAEEVLEKSKAWFKSSKSWSFNFHSETLLADSPSRGEQDGSVFVGEGNKFRLTIAGIVFICDGKSLWQWNIEQKQVLIKAVQDLESTLQPSELLFKYLNCRALSLRETKWKGIDVYLVRLSPEKYAGQFSEMEVWLSKKNFSPVRLYTIDTIGNATWYDVSDLKVRKPSKNDFTFSSVEGVDEIDMR